jgi:Tol biopolymer transport system component
MNSVLVELRGRAGWRHTRLRWWVLVLLSALVYAPAADATFQGRPGRIAFDWEVNTNNHNREIITVNRDGTGRQNMTFVGSVERNPAWSPDGTKIAFDSDRTGGTDIYVMPNVSGAGATRLTTAADYEGEPAWSPDGSKIAFRRGTGASAEIYVMDANGANQANVTNNLSFDGDPAWSPDGSKIAFASDRDDPLATELYTMDPDGSNATRLTTSSGEDANPSWAADGARIAFDSDRGGDSEIYAMDSTPGAPATQLTNDPTYKDIEPAWSPDGTKIALAKLDTGPYYDGMGWLYVMNADGSGQTGVSQAAGLNFRRMNAPDWQALPGPAPPDPYDHPAVASTLHVPLVPEFRQTISATQCQARGGLPSTHGPPLSLESCGPAGYLPSTYGRLGPNSESYAEVTAVPGDPATAPDEADVVLSLVMQDVRSPTGDDYQPYHQYVRLQFRFRVSDDRNGPQATEPGTVQDVEQRYMYVSCVPTADPSIGSTCTGTASMLYQFYNPLEDRKAVFQIFRIRVQDPGTDGWFDSSVDRYFATAGVYIP